MMIAKGSSQYLVKDDNKEKSCKGITLKDTCFDVEEASFSIWGSNQRFGIFPTVSLWQLLSQVGVTYARSSPFPTHLCTESKHLEKATRSKLVCKFFALTPSIIRWTLWICPTVDLFSREPCWFFWITFFTSGFCWEAFSCTFLLHWRWVWFLHSFFCRS